MSRFSFLNSSKKPNRSRVRSNTRRRLHIDPLESRLVLAATPIADLSDEFADAATTAQWERIHEVEGWDADQLNIYDINTTQPGRMVQQPHTTVWYQNWRGPLAFKNVTGDFVFTTDVQITDRDDIGGSDVDNVPSDGQFSLAGAMIRTPRAITNPANDWSPGSMVDDGTNNGENYIFLSLGYGIGGNEFSLEVKSTRNSNSQLELTPLGIDADSATMQIARIGNSIITLYRLPGQEWQVHRRYSRPDMPTTLQVGLVSYSDWGKASDFDPFTQNNTVLTPGIANDPTPGEPFNPDLTAGFEFARYAHPDLPETLIGADLGDPSEVTDNELLSFLGENANITSIDAPLVAIHLEVVDSTGNPVDQLEVGQSFILQATVDDLRSDGEGVFSAFLDVTYDGLLANPTGEPIFGDDYANAQEGGIGTGGLIDEVGAVASTEALGGAPRLLFTISLIATEVGELTFTGNLADLLPDHEVTLYGHPVPVPGDQIVFNSANVTIVPAVPPATAFDDEFTIFNDSQPVVLDVLANDSEDPAQTASLTIISISTIANGSATIDADGNHIFFTPAAGFYGDTSFEYALRDANGQEASATVMLSVHKRWHNSVLATDVNGDQRTSPIDALIVINSLITFGSIPLPAVPPAAMANLMYVDVNDDGYLSAGDALLVINELIRRAFERGSIGGEGESSSAAMDPVHVSPVASQLSGPALFTRKASEPQLHDVTIQPHRPQRLQSQHAVWIDHLFGSDNMEELLTDVSDPNDLL